MESEERRRSRRGAEGAAQQLSGGFAPGGFTDPPGDDSHAITVSLRSRDDGVQQAVWTIAPQVAPATVATAAPSVVAGLLGTFNGISAEPLQHPLQKGLPSVAAAWIPFARTPAGAVLQQPLRGPASPVPRRRIQAFSSPLFYNSRLVNLFIQSG